MKMNLYQTSEPAHTKTAFQLDKKSYHSAAEEHIEEYGRWNCAVLTSGLFENQVVFKRVSTMKADAPESSVEVADRLFQWPFPLSHSNEFASAHFFRGLSHQEKKTGVIEVAERSCYMYDPSEFGLDDDFIPYDYQDEE